MEIPGAELIMLHGECLEAAPGGYPISTPAYYSAGDSLMNSSFHPQPTQSASPADRHLHPWITGGVLLSGDRLYVVRRMQSIITEHSICLMNTFQSCSLQALMVENTST